VAADVEVTPAGARFSAVLRESTREEHRRAESSPFAVALAGGRLRRPGLAALAAAHHAIYSALEQVAGWMSTDPLAAPFIDRRLDRVPALRADLEYLYGADWADRMTVTPATRSYRDRILAVCAGRSGRFIAHHYVRYLGDLSGGQIVRGALERTGAATAGRGADFYTFEALPDRGAFKRGYRALLDSLPEDRDYRRELVAEARRAFALTTDVYADLARVPDAGA
jgi:heme oxygenase